MCALLGNEDIILKKEICPSKITELYPKVIRCDKRGVRNEFSGCHLWFLWKGFTTRQRQSIWGPRALLRRPLCYKEINTPVLWACQQNQSVSHFKLNSIIKSMGLSGIEGYQDHILLLQISVNNPVPMSKLLLLLNVCHYGACQPW